MRSACRRGPDRGRESGSSKVNAAQLFFDRFLDVFDEAASKRTALRLFFAGLELIRAGVTREEWLEIRDLCDAHPVSERVIAVLTGEARAGAGAADAIAPLRRQWNTSLH